MFIVKRKAEVVRFALFLLLMGSMAYYAASKLPVWRASDRGGEAVRPTRAQVASAEVSPPAQDGRDYFAEFRVDRERRRGALREVLKEVMESPAADQESRKKAADQFLEEGRLAALEAKAESAVRGRGFDDVLVDLAPSTARVVVRAASLSQLQFVQVVDLVSRITGVPPSGVNVFARER